MIGFLHFYCAGRGDAPEINFVKREKRIVERIVEENSRKKI